MARLTGRAFAGLAAVSVAATAVVTLVTPGAVFAAPANDDFTIYTTDVCQDGPGYYAGSVKFVDYGPGAKGGGNNDDYFVVADTCRDSHGVKAWAWVDGVLEGDKYVGSGAGTSAVWDPIGNVANGQKVGMKICEVDGNDDPLPVFCSDVTLTLRE
jgi:hypothetical protein